MDVMTPLSSTFLVLFLYFTWIILAFWAMPEPIPFPKIEKIRSRLICWYKKPKDLLERVATGMLIAGISIFFIPDNFLGYLPQVITNFLDGSSSDLIFSAITILVIDGLNEKRRKRLEIAELKLQMGSPNNTIAVEAARKLRSYMFQERQDRIEQLPSEERACFHDDEPVCLPSLRGLWLRKADLSKADLTWLDLNEVHLEDANLVEANFTQSYLNYAYLDRANLCNAILVETDLTGSKLQDAKLIKANLSEAIFEKANLSGADLSGANLSGARFSRAGLYNANLSGAKLLGADFARADLSGANLDGAQIGPPRLKGFAPASGWGNRTSFSGATYNDKTICPDGINLSEYGAKKDT